MRTLVFTLIFFISACHLIDGSTPEANENNAMLSITLHESPQTLSRKLPEQSFNTDRQPAGLNFYEVDFKEGERPVIRVEHGPHSFDIANVSGFMGTEDTEKHEEGIYKYTIFAAFARQYEPILHDEAREKLDEILKNLLNKGWKRLISYSEPRLSAEQSYQYTTAIDPIYGADANFTPSLKQWMQLGSRMKWWFYADNIFLDVGFRRDSSKMDPDKLGAYLLTFSLYDKEQFAKSYFDSKDYGKWQALWVDEIKKLKKIRYETEAELIEQGYTIDTSYQEPIIHPNDPVEP